MISPRSRELYQPSNQKTKNANGNNNYYINRPVNSNTQMTEIKLHSENTIATTSLNENPQSAIPGRIGYSHKSCENHNNSMNCPF